MFSIANFMTLTQKFYIVKLELYENLGLSSQLWRVTDKTYSIYMSKETYPVVPHNPNIAFGYKKYIFCDFGFFANVRLPAHSAISMYVGSCRLIFSIAAYGDILLNIF